MSPVHRDRQPRSENLRLLIPTTHYPAQRLPSSSNMNKPMRSALRFLLGIFLLPPLSGNAQFGPGQLISGDLLLSEGSHQVKPVDVDADGDLDVVIRDQTVIVYLENLDGAGTFAPADTIFSFNPLHRFDMADLDGDEDLDLVVVFAANSMVLSWARNNGNGDFQFPPTVILDPVPSFGALLCHDITGDGQPEILITTDGDHVRWFVNDGGTFTVTDSVQHLGGPASYVLLAGDLDMDGDEDQLIINWNGFVSVGLNLDGAGTSWSTEMVATGFMQGAYWGATPQLADADGDGDLDLIDAQNNVRWARNRVVEDGVWGAFDVIDIEGALFNYGVGWAGPLGCDDRASILWQTWPWGGAVQWNLFSDQLNDFAPAVSLMDTVRAVHLSAADLNGDGANDLIIADRDSSLIWWFPNELPANVGTTIEFTSFDTLCSSGDPYTLTHALPTGGARSGEGVASNVFTPAGAGSFMLTYQVVDAGTGCPLAASQPIASFVEPVITLVSGSPDECALDPLLYAATPGNGAWSGITGTDGSVDRSCAARPNSGEVTYSMNAINGGGCIATSDFLVLLGCLSVDLGSDATLCTNGDTLEFNVQGPVMGGADITGCDEVLFTPPSSVQGVFYPDHAPGDYVIIASVVGANDCPGYDTLVVSVVAHPEPQLVTQDLSFCANEPFGVLEADMVGDFSGIVNATTTQAVNFPPDQLALGFHSFTFTATNAEGCGGSFTDSLQIVALPDVMLTAPDAVDIDGGPVTFNDVTPTGGWFVIDGIETPTVDPIMYEVGEIIEVIYYYTEPSTGCTGSDTAYVLVEQITFIDGEAGSAAFHIAPNPVRNTCVVRFDGDVAAQLRLRDTLGRELRSWSGQWSPTSLDLGDVPTGTYLLSLETEAWVRYCQIVIE